MSVSENNNQTEIQMPANDDSLFKRRNESSSADNEMSNAITAKSDSNSEHGQMEHSEVPPDFFDDLLQPSIKIEKNADQNDEISNSTEVDKTTPQAAEPAVQLKAIQERISESTSVITQTVTEAIIQTDSNKETTAVPPLFLPIQVKSEKALCAEEHTKEVIPPNKVIATNTCSSPIGTEANGNTELPENFFDDLLVDNVRERLDACINNEIEIKYAKKLQELKRLEDLEKEQENKKNKHKKKKKSKKRYKENEDREQDTETRNKRRRTYSNSLNDEPPSTSRASMLPVSEPNAKQDDGMGLTSVFPDGANFQRIKLKKLEDITAVSEETKPPTLEEKIAKALNLARSLCNSDTQEDEPLFLHTSMVRKLPSSTTLYDRQSYEDRSPLNLINNVSYGFSCSSTAINLHDYGLEQTPAIVRDVARKICLDASNIYNKLANLKLHRFRVKGKLESDDGQMEVEPTGSTLYSNALIQTDCSMFKRSSFAKDINTQTEVEKYDIAVQTMENASNGILSDNTPLVKLIKQLNDNQLIALQDFAQLLTQPSDPSNHIERNYMRKRVLQIYEFAIAPIEPVMSTTDVLTNCFPFENANQIVAMPGGSMFPQNVLHMPQNHQPPQYSQNTVPNNHIYNMSNIPHQVNGEPLEVRKVMDPRTLKYGRVGTRHH